MSKINLTDVQAGYRVTSVINDNNQKIEDALENTLSRDGTSPNAMNAPIDMNSHKIINVAPGTTASDAATKGQLDSFVQNIPSTLLDQLAVKVAALIGGDVEPPQGYTNPPAPTTVTTSNVTSSSVDITITMSSTTWAEGYNVWRNGGLLTTIRGGSTLTFTDTTVQPTAIYTYTVSSYNDTYDYESTRTAATPVTIPATNSATQPGAVTNLAAVLNPDRSVFLTFAYNSAVPYNYFRVRRNGSDLGQVLASSPLTFGDYSPPVGDITYTVDAYSAGYGGYGTSDSDTVTVPPLNNNTTVDPPTSVVATAVSSTQIDVTWAYTGNTHDGFLVEISGPNDFYDSRTVNKAGRSASIGGLTPSTLYSITVSAITVNGATVGTYPASPVTATTSSGTIVTSPVFVTTQSNQVRGRINVALGTTTSPIQVTGGSGNYSFTSTTLPSGCTLSSAGVWGGTPSAYANATSVTVTVTDTTTGLNANRTFIVSIDYAVLTLTPPANISSNLIATQSSAYDSGSWTVIGGDGNYTWSTVDTLPAGLTWTTVSSTSRKIAGTGTSAVTTIYPFTVAVSSLDGQIAYLVYDLDYRAAASGNRAPTTRAGYATSYTITDGVEYTTSAPIFDANANIFIDPDNDTLTYNIAAVYDKDGNSLSLSTASNIITIGSTNLRFSKVTGKGYTTNAGSDAAALSPLTFTLEADDSQNAPLALTYNFTLTPAAGDPFPDLANAGFVATGGTGSYTYSWVSGSVPTWLASNSSTTSINSSTGKFVGGSGNVGSSPVGPLVFRVSDGSTTSDVSITFTPTTGYSSDFSSRVGGSRYATNFKDVYINGSIVAAREITAVNNLTDYTNGSAQGSGNIGHLWGESSGGTQKLNHLDWVTDPRGYGPKVARFYNLPTDSKSSGAWVRRIDGVIASSTNVGTSYPKIYTQIVFWADRNLHGYRYAGGNGELKLLIYGGTQSGGEVVLLLSKHTGFYSFLIDGSDSQSDQNQDTTNFCAVPKPNPFNNSTMRNYSMRHDTIYPAAGATKQAWYEAAGYLRSGGAAGLLADLGGSIGLDYPNKVTGAPTRYLDERSHKISGSEVGWPASYPATGKAGHIYLNAWNVVEVCVEYRGAGNLSSLALWSSKLGDPPVLNLSMINKLDINGTGVKEINVCNYDTDRIAESGRPIGYTDYESLIISENRIKWPVTGDLPQLPPGLTG